MSSFSSEFLGAIKRVADTISIEKIEKVALGLANVRAQKGRLFFLGVGGSAGNCGHAVNDFRKICGIESYAPTDNVSELTARTNDEGWESVFASWLRVSNLKANDAIFIFSVGGGNAEKNISANLVHAIDYAKQVGAGIFGVVGKDGGYTAKSSETVVIIPTANDAWITPVAEAYQGVVWHLLVTHPALKAQETKWESTAKADAKTKA
jgi:D-sedoheptulose 7-phosphate isomerase